MTPTMPKTGTKARKILDILMNADGAWINKATLVRQYGFTQAGARIFELENEYHWPVEHSKDTDSYGFKSYRILQETKTLSLF